MNNATREHQALPEEMSIKKQVPFIDLYSLSVLVISFFIVIKYFHSRAIGLNTSRDRIYPQLKLGKIREYSPVFKPARVAKKDVQNNKHNSLHLGRKICSGICRWTLSVPISKRIMSADKWRLVYIYLNLWPPHPYIYLKAEKNYLTVSTSSAPSRWLPLAEGNQVAIYIFLVESYLS